MHVACLRQMDSSDSSTCLEAWLVWGDHSHEFSEQVWTACSPSHLGSVLLKARGLKGKKRLVLKRKVCLPGKQRTETSGTAPDGAPVTHELISTPRAAAHQS